MTTGPYVVERAEQPYAGITRSVTMQTFNEVADRIPQIIGWLAEHGSAPAGAPFLRYHVIDMEGRFEVEAGVPVAEPITGDETVDAGVLPGGRYATVTHIGHPDELVEVTADLLAWAAEKGLSWDMAESPEGERWACRLELFKTDPRVEPDLNKWETDLAIRLDR